MSSTALTAPTPLSRAAYDDLAPYYDQFTAAYRHDEWIGNLAGAAENLGLSGARLLDVGCGTGKSFIWMLARGWEVLGVDVSPAMIERAQAKATGATLALADMRELGRLGEFDLVWALDDAVNYLESIEELEMTCRGFAANVAPSGLVVFDTNTLLTYRTFFSEGQVVEAGDTTFLWDGLGDGAAEPGCVAEAEFTVVAAGGERRLARHRQQHFSEADVRHCLAQADLELVAVYGHHFDAVLRQPLDEDLHTKAVYFARPR
jgi:SAM-dependent methyltransferase